MLPWSVVLVASTSSGAASFRPELDGAGERTASWSTSSPVDVSRLGDRVGRVTIEQHWQVDAALLTVIGLD